MIGALLSSVIVGRSVLPRLMLLRRALRDLVLEGGAGGGSLGHDDDMGGWETAGGCWGVVDCREEGPPWNTGYPL